MIISKLNNYIYKFLIILILGIGIFLRIKLYLQAIPFEFDECLSGMRFYEMNFSDLFKAVNCFCKIPPLWMVLHMGILKLFGFSFYTFRIVSLISGILSLFAFFVLIKNTLKNKIAILTGLLLFSVNYWLIHYSAEFRPYSSDVLISVLLLLSYKYITFKELTVKKTVLYTLISVFLVLFSFTSMFIIPSIILVKSFEEKKFNFKCLWIFLGIILTLLYLYLIDLDLYKYALNYYTVSEVGLLNFTFQDISQLINKLFRYIFNIYDDKYYIKYVFLAGLISFFIDKQKYGLLYISIIILMFTAACLKVYPMFDRHCLYLCPMIILAVSKLIEVPVNITNIEKIPVKLLLTVKSILIAVFIFYLLNFNNIFNLNYDFDNNKYSYYGSYVRINAMKFAKSVLENYKSEEMVITSSETYVLLRFYNHYFNINKEYQFEFLPILNIEQQDKINNIFLDILNKETDKANFYFTGRFHSFSISPDIDFMKQELKKRKIKYNEYSDDIFYYIQTLM